VCFEIANDGAVTVALAPSPVVDANHARRASIRGARRRTTRRSVSRLTGRTRRLAVRWPGRPPSARPM
jgi:hypothetical protein